MLAGWHPLAVRNGVTALRSHCSSLVQLWRICYHPCQPSAADNMLVRRMTTWIFSYWFMLITSAMKSSCSLSAGIGTQHDGFHLIMPNTSQISVPCVLHHFFTICLHAIVLARPASFLSVFLGSFCVCQWYYEKLCTSAWMPMLVWKMIHISLEANVIVINVVYQPWMSIAVL